MSFFATLTCQHGHRHEGARCDRPDCQLCCTELRECDVARFVRHLLRSDDTITDAGRKYMARWRKAYGAPRPGDAEIIRGPT